MGSSLMQQIKNRICYILVGVSGAGKSTAAKKLAAQHLAESSQPLVCETFSLDTCRMDFCPFELSGNAVADYNMAFNYANANPKDFAVFVNAAWAKALKADIVFVDNTNLHRKARMRWITEARNAKFTVVAVQFMVPLQTLILRQSTRSDKSVGADIVKAMYMRQTEVKIPEEADHVLFSAPDEDYFYSAGQYPFLEQVKYV